MKDYITVEGILYTLSKAKLKKFNEIYPTSIQVMQEDDEYNEMLDWLTTNGTVVGTCHVYDYR